MLSFSDFFKKNFHAADTYLNRKRYEENCVKAIVEFIYEEVPDLIAYADKLRLSLSCDFNWVSFEFNLYAENIYNEYKNDGYSYDICDPMLVPHPRLLKDAINERIAHHGFNKLFKSIDLVWQEEEPPTAIIYGDHEPIGHASIVTIATRNKNEARYHGLDRAFVYGQSNKALFRKLSKFKLFKNTSFELGNRGIHASDELSIFESEERDDQWLVQRIKTKYPLFSSFSSYSNYIYIQLKDLDEEAMARDPAYKIKTIARGDIQETIALLLGFKSWNHLIAAEKSVNEISSVEMLTIRKDNLDDVYAPTLERALGMVEELFEHKSPQHTFVCVSDVGTYLYFESPFNSISINTPLYWPWDYCHKDEFKGVMDLLPLKKTKSNKYEYQE